ncbi:hypothetical protein O181_002771 [Austropuccinia psidii MF-1]|uniref:Tetrapyrrole biosynthesis uroporphyrinogen III synthase domain-containing protein n=1 Tax=Austropuccinia psidii MF-1 TaxID=1389203 RepID=A0A9Q3BDL3_9BASI|nr:hypothetical protein [Austropuccinia psidii MF-1]
MACFLNALGSSGRDPAFDGEAIVEDEVRRSSCVRPIPTNGALASGVCADVACRLNPTASSPSTSLSGMCSPTRPIEQLRKTVVLVKTPSDSCPQDPYTRSLKADGYESVFLPILKTSFNSLDRLGEIIHEGVEGRWDGVVVTSPRSVGAIQEALNQLDSSSTAHHTNRRDPNLGWDTIPFFAVGPSTAQALSSLTSSERCFPSGPRLKVVGQDESGCGSKLAKFINLYYDPSSESNLKTNFNRPKPVNLLYVTGDHPHPALRDTLLSSRPPFVLTELQVYSTSPFETPKLDPPFFGRASWVVFFSPRSAEAALPALNQHIDFNLNSLETKIAVIGFTTEKWLHSQARRQADAVASKPEPKSLVEAIVTADNQHYEKTPKQI